jgi:hypothetical protein
MKRASRINSSGTLNLQHSEILLDWFWLKEKYWKSIRKLNVN